MATATDWLTNEIKQVPGLIKSEWGYLTRPLVQGESCNIPFEQVERFCTFIRLVEGLASPVAFVDPGQGDYSYIVDQIGIVYRYSPDSAAKSQSVRVDRVKGTTYQYADCSVTHTPLIDMTRVINHLNPLYDERGLISMVFDPINKDTFYLYYTVPSPDTISNCDVVVEQWTISAVGDPLPAKPVKTILRWNHPEANHFGSLIGFAPDGLLYLATGDGGGAGDKHGTIGNSQDPKSPWGKVFQIDVRSKSAMITTYSMGHRNPWRASFTRDGKPIIGDVGQNKWEGITVDERGSNHGWRALENGHVYDQALYDQSVAEGVKLTPPCIWYDRSLGKCVIGGYVINDQGDYLFGDYTGGKYGDNVYLVRDGVLLIQTARDKQRPKYLQSFGTDRDGKSYGLFTTSAEKTDKGVLYRIDFM